MAISLADIKRNTIGPPRIVVYGVPGIGKTTLAACAPSPIFLPVEDGLGRIDAPAFPRPTSYQAVIESIDALLAGGHDYGSFVLDSLDALEPLLWQHVCATHGKQSIEDFGYGKGYVAAAAEWRNLLAGFDALRGMGMCIVLIAHSSVVRFESPETDPYDRWQLRLDKRADGIVCDWADAVLFANYKTTAVTSGPKGSERRRGVGNGDRVLHTVERPAWRAKNRYALPDQIPIPVGDPGEAWAVIENAVAGTSPAVAQPA